MPASFFFRLLGLDGSEPVVDVCVNCGRAEPLVAFDAGIGGTLCGNCRQGVALSLDALALIRRMLGGDLGAVLKNEPPAGAGEVMALAQEAIEGHFGRRLRAPGAVGALGGTALPIGWLRQCMSSASTSTFPFVRIVATTAPLPPTRIATT